MPCSITVDLVHPASISAAINSQILFIVITTVVQSGRFTTLNMAIKPWVTPPILFQRHPVLKHHTRLAVTMQKPPTHDIQPQPAMGGAVVAGRKEHQAQMFRHRDRLPGRQVVVVFKGFEHLPQVVGINGNDRQVDGQMVAVDIAHQSPAVLLSIDPGSSNVVVDFHNVNPLGFYPVTGFNDSCRYCQNKISCQSGGLFLLMSYINCFLSIKRQDW